MRPRLMTKLTLAFVLGCMGFLAGCGPARETVTEGTGGAIQPLVPPGMEGAAAEGGEPAQVVTE